MLKPFKRVLSMETIRVLDYKPQNKEKRVSSFPYIPWLKSANGQEVILKFIKVKSLLTMWLNYFDWINLFEQETSHFKVQTFWTCN